MITNYVLYTDQLKKLCIDLVHIHPVDLSWASYIINTIVLLFLKEM